MQLQQTQQQTGLPERSFPMSTSRKLLMAESSPFVPPKNFTGRALSPGYTKTVSHFPWASETSVDI